MSVITLEKSVCLEVETGIYVDLEEVFEHCSDNDLVNLLEVRGVATEKLINPGLVLGMISSVIKANNAKSPQDFIKAAQEYFYQVYGVTPNFSA